MRLSSSIKQKFVKDVMEGIPRKHKWSKDEELTKIRAELHKLLPDDIQKFLKDHPDLLQYNKQFNINVLNSPYVNPRGFNDTMRHYVYTISHKDIDLEKIDISKYVKLQRAWLDENAQRETLSKRLMEIADSCTTLKALKAALPEFESYMPEEVVVNRNLPVAAGSIVTDLLAAGLKVPKGDKNAEV